MARYELRGTIIQISISPGGVPKRPVAEAWIRSSGVDGDSWAHPRFHGGQDQRVLIVTTESIAELRELGYDIYPGALGENLTVEGLDRRHLRAGQIYRAGDALIELTKLRVPCRTLDVYGPGVQQQMMDVAAKAKDPASPLWARGGFYARVLREGIVRAGDIIAQDDSAGRSTNASSV